jgi:PAS domain S-box-containing protein
MFGVPPDGKITLQTFIDALHPDDRDGVMRHWRHCVENRVPFSSDMRTVRPDNSVRWIHGRGKGYYDKSGEPISMVGLAFDITERKQIEQQLARANEQLRLALEAGAVGGWDWEH